MGLVFGGSLVVCHILLHILIISLADVREQLINFGYPIFLFRFNCFQSWGVLHLFIRHKTFKCLNLRNFSVDIAFITRSKFLKMIMQPFIQLMAFVVVLFQLLHFFWQINRPYFHPWPFIEYVLLIFSRKGHFLQWLSWGDPIKILCWEWLDLWVIVSRAGYGRKINPVIY